MSSAFAFEFSKLEVSAGIHGALLNFAHDEYAPTTAFALSPILSTSYRFNRSQKVITSVSLASSSSSNEELRFYESIFHVDVNLGYEHRVALSRSFDFWPTVQLVSGYSSFSDRYYLAQDGYLDQVVEDEKGVLSTGVLLGGTVTFSPFINSRIDFGLNGFYRLSFGSELNTAALGVLVNY